METTNNTHHYQSD